MIFKKLIHYLARLNKKSEYIFMQTKIPRHWKSNSWEDKAKENPFFAIQTSDQMVDSDPSNFSQKHLKLLFDKGELLAKKYVLPYAELLQNKNGFILDYGCGAGRVLKPLVEKNLKCVGVDISQTMLNHCKKLVPSVHKLILVKKDGSLNLKDNSAKIVFSIAVLKHIEKLSVYLKALSEMSRVLDFGGYLIIQINCEDYHLKKGSKGKVGRTENYEDYSVHYPPGSDKSYIHHNNTWSGVYIGINYIEEFLLENKIKIISIEPFNLKKPRTIMLIGKKIRV